MKILIKILFLLIISLSINGCVSTIVSGNIKSSVDPSFPMKTNTKIIILSKDINSIYYLPQLKESLLSRGFKHVEISETNIIPTAQYDMKIELDVKRDRETEKKMVDDYGVIGTKITPGDFRCKEKNTPLLGKKIRCKSDGATIKKVYGVTGKKEKIETTLKRQVELIFTSLKQDKEIANVTGSSIESDYKCSDIGIFNFLITHTIKYLNFTKPLNTNYSVELQEGYNCNNFNFKRVVKKYNNKSRNFNDIYKENHNKTCINGNCKNAFNISSLEYFSSKFNKDRCIDGNCKNGHGTYLNSNGDKYIGQWKDNMMHGKVTIITNNFKIIYAEFKNGKII